MSRIEYRLCIYIRNTESEGVNLSYDTSNVIVLCYESQMRHITKSYNAVVIFITHICIHTFINANASTQLEVLNITYIEDNKVIF